MKLNVAFGKDGLTLDLPEGYAYRVLEAKSAAPLGDVTKSLEDALDAPIGSAPLRDLARGKRTAAISVCDITRPAPNALTLPPLLARLHEVGITPDDVTILIATGLHRAATEDEILRIVGPEIASRYRIVNHHAKELGEHRFLGATSRGTPVYIDDRFMAADLHITLGFIEQHLMLGFSGGRKLIAPGLAAQETIKVLHSPPFMREPKAIEGSTAGNPLHQELLEIARMARHDFMLDTALTRTREIAGVFAGDPVRAHAAGVQFVSEALLERLPEPVDAVLTTAAGYPLDLTFYQAIKGVTAAQHIVKPGGRILLVAECAEGAGAIEFAQKLQEFGTYGELLRQIAQAPVVVDQWQIEKLALAGEKYQIFFYVPGLPGELRKGLGGRVYNRPQEAIAAFLKGMPENASVAVIPDGPYVYARVEEPVFA
jgi:lactate racemase